MVFMTATDMSVAQYQVFVEVMSFATIESIRTLPKSISTLKGRCRRHMPLARLRKHSLPVKTDKVPPKSENPKTAYRFEVEECARLLLADGKLMKNMHFRMELVEQHRRGFWHGDSWLGSIRSTSSQFAWLANGEEPLLPSQPCQPEWESASSNWETPNPTGGVARRFSMDQLFTVYHLAEPAIPAS